RLVRVEVVGHQGTGVSFYDCQLMAASESAFPRGRTIVGAAVEDIVLLPVHARDHRPGRVVVRGRGAARGTGGGVKRKAVIAVLREAVGSAERSLWHREACGRKQVGPNSQRD